MRCRVNAICGDKAIAIVLALFRKPYVEGSDGEFVRINVESKRGAEGIYRGREGRWGGAMLCGWTSTSRGGFGPRASFEKDTEQEFGKADCALIPHAYLTDITLTIPSAQNLAPPGRRWFVAVMYTVTIVGYVGGADA